MARFRLLAGHTFTTTLGLAYFETDSEIESHEVVGFHCTALMEALDATAEELLEAEYNRLIAEAKDFGCVIGFGATSTLPPLATPYGQ